MKNLIKLLLMLCLSTLVGIGCDKQDLPECIKGTVVGYEYCSNAVLIQVASHSEMGREITYYNDSTYTNVVKAPGGRGQYGGGEIYFSYRQYNRENDSNLFKYEDYPCLMNAIPFSVPIIVVTNYSTTNCPLNNER